MLGSGYGQLLHHVAPGVAGAAGAYGLIGMGAVFAGAARAPITAVIIMFELTGEYTIILPLMTAIVLATAVSRLLSHDTIYTLKLRRRGVDLDEPPHSPAMSTVTAGEVMDPAEDTLPQRTTLLDAAELVSRSPHGLVAVLDEQGGYRGVVTARAVADALADGEHDNTPVASIVELPQTVLLGRLDETLDALDAARTAIPVLDREHANVVGWLTHQRVLSALHRLPTSTGQHRRAQPPLNATRSRTWRDHGTQPGPPSEGGDDGVGNSPHRQVGDAARTAQRPSVDSDDRAKSASQPVSETRIR